MTWPADWRVYLHLPATHIPTDLDRLIAEALETGAVGAVEVPLGGLSDGQAAQRVDHLRSIIQPTGVPLLAHGTTRRDLYARLDGIRLDDPEELDGARRSLGTGALVGVTVDSNRDDAMSAGEREPDFVYLPPDKNFVGWWADLMVIPCVAPGGDTLSSVGDMLEQGPDFIAMDDVAWNHPDGPAAAIKALKGLIAA